LVWERAPSTLLIENKGFILEYLLSIEEAARRLGGLSKYTIHAWLSKGKLRRTKVGSRTMITEKNLQAFIDSCNLMADEAAGQRAEEGSK
jgi:excisionase family DNA binding protein